MPSPARLQAAIPMNGGSDGTRTSTVPAIPTASIAKPAPTNRRAPNRHDTPLLDPRAGGPGDRRRREGDPGRREVEATDADQGQRHVHVDREEPEGQHATEEDRRGQDRERPERPAGDQAGERRDHEEGARHEERHAREKGSRPRAR